MKRIILDTNFLLIPVQFRVDVFVELKKICDFNYEICVLDKTIDELNKIIKEAKKGKDKEAAKIALQLVKAKKIKILKTKEDKYVDDLLLDYKDAIIATQDIALARRLKKKGIKTIALRNKNYLVFRV